jgi:competence protein CoiA
MLVAKRRSGKRVIAAEEPRSKGPWGCPQCAEPVVLKKGEIKVHHFAHAAKTDCEYGGGESDEHRQCKMALFNTLRKLPGSQDWELEWDLKEVRPDLIGRLKDQTGKVRSIAIEVQASSLGLHRILERTKHYGEKRIPILWLVPWNSELETGRYSPSAWERWLHTLYFGRVYYWKRGARVVPIHFSEYMLHVEARTWYDEDGDEQEAGGYDRVSKRWKTPIAGPEVDITEMHPTLRKAWSGGAMRVPDCGIWIDSLKRWW